MSGNENKILSFEYFVSLLIEWHHEKFGSNDNSFHDSFSRLKILKLLFLAAAVDAGKDNDGLLDVFSNFVAMPHGPVESDIYNGIVNSKMKVYELTDKSLSIIGNIQSEQELLAPSLIKRITDSVDLLKKKNINLITYSAFELVEITHKWNCWSILYNYALSKGLRSIQMPSMTIKMSLKYYS